MVLIEESRNDAEATIAVAGAQQRVVPKRSLNDVINYAYVFYQLKKELAPCIQENAEDGTLTSIIKLAERFSKNMQLVVPRQQLIEPPPAQMLRFTNDIPAEIFTNRLIDLQIELVNIESGLICSTGEPSSPLQVEIFVTRGSFPSNDRKLRKCKPLRPRNKATMPLLVQVTGTKTARRGCSFKNKFVSKLHKGRADVKVKITDNSSWVRTKMFKLVARVVKGSYQGRRIKEALSEAFAVKESKLEGKKADVPSPTDSTSKLINVGKKYYKILQAMEINTVHDFLNKLESDPEGLKTTVGMQNTKWESTVDHARQCRVSPEQEPSMTETNKEAFAFGQDTNVLNSGVITDRLLIVSVPNADLPHTPEIQAQYMVMGQQRDPAACFGSDHSNPISSLNGNNESFGEAFGEMSGQPEMPEQVSTGQGMTMDNNSNWNQGPSEHSTIMRSFARLESNQWENDFFRF